MPAPRCTACSAPTTSPHGTGGEEFAVLLPGTDVSVTASIGVSTYPDHASTPDRPERLADGALYSAKRHGRNRIELADPASVETTSGPVKSPMNGTQPDPHLPHPASTSP